MAAKEKKVERHSSGNVEEGKVCALLSYLLIGVIWYFVDEKMKSNSFVKFHAKQGLVLFLFSIGWSVVLGIVTAVTSFGLLFLWPIIGILRFVPLIFGIMGIMSALNGEEKELFLIGKYANQWFKGL